MRIPCKGMLIEKLVALLREAGPDEFDEVMAQAKNQLTAEQKQSKRNDLEKLFNAQIETLEDRGVPDQIIEIFQNQKGAVLKKASEMAIGSGNIPFLPVILQTFRGPHGLMAMVRSGSKEGYTRLKLATITDQFETPDGFYYIYDVENGNATRGKSSQRAEKNFKKQRRSPLTAAEVVNLCILTDVLSKHYVWAVGSRYGSADRVPNVGHDNRNRPRLGWDQIDVYDDRWGSASCGSRGQ